MILSGTANSVSQKVLAAALLHAWFTANLVSSIYYTDNIVMRYKFVLSNSFYDVLGLLHAIIICNAPVSCELQTQSGIVALILP